ncbi:ABC-three component system middle component 6, partial [Mycoplasmopsis bovis]
ASLILNTLYEQKSIDIITLYAEVKKPDNMPISIFLLSLDWLYLIGAIDINDNGVVFYVFKKFKNL